MTPTIILWNKILLNITEFFQEVGNRILIVASFILGILHPISQFYHVIIVFVVLNFISGYIDDIRSGGKFEFKKFRAWLLRVLFYIMAITMVFIFERYVIVEFGITSKALTASITAFIALYELQSFLYNASKITKISVFTRIYEKIRDYYFKANKN